MAMAMALPVETPVLAGNGDQCAVVPFERRYQPLLPYDPLAERPELITVLPDAVSVFDTESVPLRVVTLDAFVTATLPVRVSLLLIVVAPEMRLTDVGFVPNVVLPDTVSLPVTVVAPVIDATDVALPNVVLPEPVKALETVRVPLIVETLAVFEIAKLPVAVRLLLIVVAPENLFNDVGFVPNVVLPVTVSLPVTVVAPVMVLTLGAPPRVVLPETVRFVPIVARP